MGTYCFLKLIPAIVFQYLRKILSWKKNIKKKKNPSISPTKHWIFVCEVLTASKEWNYARINLVRPDQFWNVGHVFIHEGFVEGWVTCWIPVGIYPFIFPIDACDRERARWSIPCERVNTYWILFSSAKTIKL